jgi:hypothetical protein
MSMVCPCGRGVLSKSVVGAMVGFPVSIAGEVDLRW